MTQWENRIEGAIRGWRKRIIIMASKGKAKYFSESAQKGAQRGATKQAPPAKRTPEASGLTEDEVREEVVDDAATCHRVAHSEGSRDQ